LALGRYNRQQQTAQRNRYAESLARACNCVFFEAYAWLVACQHSRLCLDYLPDCGLDYNATDLRLLLGFRVLLEQAQTRLI
jgi:hypothetical protein